MTIISEKHRQEDRVRRERRAPLNISREEWIARERSKTLPPGSIWLGCIGPYGPKDSAPFEESRRDLQ